LRLILAPVLLFSALSGLLLLTGCRSSASKPGDLSASQEHLASKGDSGAAGDSGDVGDWVEPVKLSKLELRKLGMPDLEVPQDQPGIMLFLKSKKVDRRIFGLIGAWQKKLPGVMPFLIRMTHKDRSFSPVVAGIIASYPEPLRTSSLLRVCASRWAKTRSVAARELRFCAPALREKVIPVLLRLLQRDIDWRVQVSAVRSMAWLTQGQIDWKTTKLMVKLLDDKNRLFPVKIECAAMLARGGSQNGWQILQANSGGRNYLEAALTLRVVAEVGGQRAAALLGAGLRSAKTEVWEAALRGFSQIEPTEALAVLVPLVNSGGQVGHRAALALAWFRGRRVLPEILEAMRGGTISLRKLACELLAAIGGEDAAAVLEARLADDREAQSVRVAAARSLGKIGGPTSLATIKAICNSESDAVVRDTARDVLRIMEARQDGGQRLSPAARERAAFSRWQLVSIDLGAVLGCRLKDERGREQQYRVGQQVALGYRLTRVLGAGDRDDAPETIMAGPGALLYDRLRVILSKNDRSVVLTLRAIKARE
jgi:HEAT repeat protein